MKKSSVLVLLPLAALLGACHLGTTSSAVASSPASSASESSSTPSSSASKTSSTTSSSSTVSSSSSSSSSSSRSLSSSNPNSSSSVAPSDDVALISSAEFTNFWSYPSQISLGLRFSNASIYALSHYGTIDDQKWGDVYFPCTLTVKVDDQQYVFEEAGARMKGNTSRREIADASGNITNSCHFKISLKATFDDTLYDLDQFKAFKHDWSADPTGLATRKKRTLFDMEKFDLKYLPRNQSQTLSQEIYCYDSFRSFDVLAPHAKWANVALTSDASTQSYVYEIIEDIDKVFLKRHFSKAEAKGDLYKCVWGNATGEWKSANLARDGAVEKNDTTSPLTSGARVANGRIGVEDNYTGYHPNYQLKTNDNGEASDFSAMANYINTIWNLRYKKALQNTLESVLDVQEYLRFEAASYLFGNFDDQRNNGNNYYLYFRPSDKKAIYIPYDWDWAMGAMEVGKSLDMSSFTPFQTTGLNGTIDTNIYWVTFFKTSGLAYDQTSYIATYTAAIKEAVAAGLLSGDAYAKFAAKAPSNLGTGDVAKAQSYCTAKLKTIASSLA